MDIENNNHAFAHEFFKSLQSLNISVSIASSPMVPDSLAAVLGVDQETKEITQLSAVGCSDDERYSGEWRAENYAAVTLLSIIGCLILVGSLMDLYDRFPIGGNPDLSDVKKPAAGLGYKILTAFSAVTNLEFIFKRFPVSGKGQRLSCLEGMRAISMTWVILGHNFAFGATMLRVRNPAFMNQIYNKQTGPAIEAIMEGELSVDTFLFIGATLVSYLLLKELDRSNGWFHGRGAVRMALFYINRYLRSALRFTTARVGVEPGLQDQHPLRPRADGLYRHRAPRPGHPAHLHPQLRLGGGALLQAVLVATPHLL